jgi:predicted anti-sigma-YlaC factor YlaD
MTKTPSVNVMDCTETREWVQRKLDGEKIPDELVGKFQMHLVSCGECATWSANMHKVVARVARLREPGPSFGFESRLMRVLGLTGVTGVPLWMKWAAWAALGMAGAWGVLIFLVGGQLVSGASAGLSYLPRALRFGKHLSLIQPNVATSLPDILNLAFIVLGAAVILIVLGLLAMRMLRRKEPSTPRNV